MVFPSTAEPPTEAPVSTSALPVDIDEDAGIPSLLHILDDVQLQSPLSEGKEYIHFYFIITNVF